MNKYPLPHLTCGAEPPDGVSLQALIPTEPRRFDMSVNSLPFGKTPEEAAYDLVMTLV